MRTCLNCTLWFACQRSAEACLSHGSFGNHDMEPSLRQPAAKDVHHLLLCCYITLFTAISGGCSTSLHVLGLATISSVVLLAPPANTVPTHKIEQYEYDLS